MNLVKMLQTMLRKYMIHCEMNQNDKNDLEPYMVKQWGALFKVKNGSTGNPMPNGGMIQDQFKEFHIWNSCKVKSNGLAAFNTHYDDDVLNIFRGNLDNL